MTTDCTVQPVTLWFAIPLQKGSQQAENSEFFIVNKSVTADGRLLSPTGSVNTIHPAPDFHEHFTIQKGYGTWCTFSCTISTILTPL